MKWFFTGYAPVIHSQIKALQGRIDAWEAFVPQNARQQQRLETQIADLREELDAHKAALHKLRGQFHGPRGAEVSNARREPAFPPLTTKDALRRRAGIVAGLPARHEPQQDNEDE